MSGVQALANPHRIKAAHRRRRKCASGQSVQRYYDPTIGRFLSVDPVTANPKNGTNFNRYWYAANNPYKYVDPDGRVIKIKGSSADPEFKSKVADDLDKIMATKAGAELVRQLQSSKHVFYIVPSANKNATAVAPADRNNSKSQGVGSGAIVIFNPANANGGGRDSTGSQNRPAFIGLAHELGHAKLADEGRYNDNYEPQVNRSTPPAEKDNLPIENSIRRENNLPERTWYYDWPEE